MQRLCGASAERRRYRSVTEASETDTMNTFTALTVLVVVVAAGINSAHGLTCYQGVPDVQMIKVPCAGSCVTVTSGSNVAVGCSPTRMADQCVQTAAGKACFCNTDLCNSGKSVESILWSVLLQSVIAKNKDVVSFQENN